MVRWMMREDGSKDNRMAQNEYKSEIIDKLVKRPAFFM
jgi:hypothetical protein